MFDFIPVEYKDKRVHWFALSLTCMPWCFRVLWNGKRGNRNSELTVNKR